MKKAITTAAGILCLILFLVLGCEMTGGRAEDGTLYFSNAGQAEIMKDLAVFCNEHRERLNEMSEYFIDAAEDISDYEDDEKLPDIKKLAAAFTDEESKEILEKLDPYYPTGFGEEFKAIYYYYSYDYEGEYADPEYEVVYIKKDGKELEEFFYAMHIAWEVRKIDKYLFAVQESWPRE